MIILLIGLSILAAVVSHSTAVGGLANFRDEPNAMPGYAVILTFVTTAAALVFLVIGLLA